MASGHEHDDSQIPPGDTVSKDPIDAKLWIHMFTMAFTFGILFPLGMVLGMIKSRWHVPLQAGATVLAIVGTFFGHAHGGRQFVASNVHGQFANTVFLLLILQVVLGGYLKLHWEKGMHRRVRPFARAIHSVNGKAFPVVAWTQMLFGGITALGFCQGDHLGQCLAHFIMGSGFIAYGIILTLLLLVGQLWLRRTGRSQEFFDSAVIAAWGCVNTFTEHRWGTAWVRNDWQHTTMGVVWWAAGLAGVWLSRDRQGRPQRNFIPGFVLLLTGWAMSAHPQELMISAMTHKMFGYTLMAAGVTRMIEISFILGDKPGVSETGFATHSFQYIPVFLLYASGFLFMGATEEQMLLVASAGIDHVAYVLILYSLAFIVFLWVCVLLHIYDRSANGMPGKKPALRINGHAAAAATVGSGLVGADEEGRLHDAEEFELNGLMSDDEDEDQAARRKLLSQHDDDAGLASPSTVGRNSDRVA